MSGVAGKDLLIDEGMDLFIESLIVIRWFSEEGGVLDREGLKAGNVKPPKASLDAMDILKFTGGIRGRVLVKDYAVYKKMDQRVIQQKFYDPYRVIKLLFNTRKVWRSASLNHWSVVCSEAASLHALFRSGKDLCACQKHLSC